ncbi:MAG: DUF1543 domain-containing protein [Chitinophagaceae bacterium]|nr:MAG: DUF1543 domain-containing protein [Chitinophagaceae bacterium]
MILLGCRPAGRHTEQHDIFFTIANNLEAAKPAISRFWPDGGKLHIDAWRSVTSVNGYSVEVVARDAADNEQDALHLYFVNLGGYKPGVFEEFHYKMLVVATDKSAAISEAKKTAFYQHTGFKGADSHIDDKYGVDVDDVEAIEDILPEAERNQFALRIQPGAVVAEDAMHLGYFKWSKLDATMVS